MIEWIRVFVFKHFKIDYLSKCKRIRSDGPTPCLCCIWKCKG